MSSAEQWLRTPRPPVLLHMISDFQRSGAPLRFADLEPPAGSQLVMHDVSGPERDDVFIADVSLSEGDTRALEIEVRSTSDSPQDRDVVVLIDGKEHARRRARLDASASVSMSELAVVGEGGGRVGANRQSSVPQNSL